MSVCLWWKIRKKKKDNHCEDGLEGPVPNVPSKPLPPSATVSDIQNSIELNPDAPKLTHVNKDRARRPKNVRPTTRQSGMPRTQSENSLKVDENVEDFFSKPSTVIVNSIPEKKEETPFKSPSTKSTPESKKKMGGFFNFAHKDKEQKDTKGKEPKKGGLLSKLHGSPKSSPSPNKSRISNVQEEPEEESINKNNSGLTRSTTENSSLRGSMDKKSEKPKDDQSPKVPRSATENVSLSGSLDRKSDKSDTISTKSDSDSLSRKSDKSNSLDSRKSDKSGDKSPVNVAESEPAKSEDVNKAKDDKSESSSENETEETTGKGTEADKDKVENGDAKKEEKKPLQLPSTKRSFSKADAKKEKASDDTVEEKPEEKDATKESVKDEKENKETEDIIEKKEEEEVKEEVKDSEAEKDKEEPDKTDENKPLSVARKPGVPGGIGFGLNIMADLKAKQEKRRSQMPSKPAAPPPDQTENRGSATEEKKSPFGLHNLKPVTKTVPKENTSAPVKPSDNKSSDSVKSAEVPALKTRTGSVGTDNKGGSSDTKTVTPVAKADQKATKNNSLKDSGAEKPSVTPRPSGLNKPPPPTRPKPPITSSKPTPAPRKSLSSTDSTEHDEEVNKPGKKPAEGGVVYDSATLKMSVKDKISKFRSSGSESEAGKGKPLSQPEKKEHVISRDSKKSDSLPSDSDISNAEKSSSLSKETTPSDINKGETTPEAGDLDLRKIEENTSMTDSGIVDDSPRSSVKDALSKFDSNDVGLRKHGSLPRHMKKADAVNDGEESPKRPKSMFALVDSRPDLKKPAENKAVIPEEKEKDSPTEEVILV